MIDRTCGIIPGGIMKRLVALVGLVGLFSSFSFAGNDAVGPRFFCRSNDNVKVVRIKPAAFGNRMQAEVLHNGSLYQILPCEMYANDMMYYCSDNDPSAARVFTISQDGMTGLYEGTRETREFSCRQVSR